MTTSRVNPMIMISLILALMLVFATIYLSFMQPAKTSKPIKIVSGEWAPFTGENLKHNGIATLIVSSVMEQMGYTPSYEFIPWPLAQSRAESSQRNDHIRAIYPYIKTAEREKRFYFSEGIVDIAFGVFYHRGNNPEGLNITNHQALSAHRILAFEGYEYGAEIEQYLAPQPCYLKDTVEGLEHLVDAQPSILLTQHPILQRTLVSLARSDSAVRLKLSKILSDVQTQQITLTGTTSPIYVSWLKDERTITPDAINKYRVITIENSPIDDQIQSIIPTQCRQEDIGNALIALAYSGKPAVLMEAQQVAENLILQRLPEQANSIRRAAYFRSVEHRMMFPKNNPNNLDLRDEFDEVLIRLKSNKDAYNSLIRKAKNAIELAQAISLSPSKDKFLIEAFRFDAQKDSCVTSERYMLPRGSKAKINQWSDIFLKPNDEDDSPMVIVKLLNGPLSAKNTNFCVSARSIKIN